MFWIGFGIGLITTPTLLVIWDRLAMGEWLWQWDSYSLKWSEEEGKYIKVKKQ